MTRPSLALAIALMSLAAPVQAKCKWYDIICHIFGDNESNGRSPNSGPSPNSGRHGGVFDRRSDPAPAPTLFQPQPDPAPDRTNDQHASGNSGPGSLSSGPGPGAQSGSSGSGPGSSPAPIPAPEMFNVVPPFENAALPPPAQSGAGGLIAAPAAGHRSVDGHSQHIGLNGRPGGSAPVAASASYGRPLVDGAAGSGAAAGAATAGMVAGSEGASGPPDRSAGQVSNNAGGQLASMLRIPLMGGTARAGGRGNGSVDLSRSAATKFGMGDFAGAVADATKAIEQGQPEAFAVRAAAHNRLGDYKAAERDALKAIEFDGKDSRAWAALAWSQLRQRKYADALRSADMAVQLNSLSATNHALLAAAKEVNGDRAAGLESLAAAAQLNPEMYQAKYEAAKNGAKIYDETEDSLLGGMIAKSLGNRQHYGLGVGLVGGIGLLAGLFIAAGIWLFRRPSAAAVATVRFEAPAVPARQGDSLGKYRLVRVMGRGGMGEVYEGVDTSLNRPVAIKKLAERYAEQDPAARASMLKEARTVASLHHPAIVDIYDVIEADSLYLVFEYLSGRTLHQLLAEAGGRLPPAKAVEVLKPVCEALEFAHSRGLVHRDLKPANVMITDLGQVKLMDFGIARSLSDAAPVTALAGAPAAAGTGAKPDFFAARTTTVTGTGPYMGPESAGGIVCKEGDVYAAGVTLYELVTGRLPFSAQAGASAKFTMTYARPSSVVPTLPKALDEVVEKCLQAEPDKRYRSAGELLAALRALPTA